MITVSDKDFEAMVAKAIDAIPERYAKHISNVAFIIEDEPNRQQRIDLGLHCNQSLYGLYQGVPLPQRGGVQPLLPDKITIFKWPILYSADSIEAAQAQINNTVWHEVAHYFGLNHERIHALEKNSKRG